MRKTFSALAVCGVVVGLVAGPASATPGPKAPKTHSGTVSLVVPSPAAGTTTTTASGNVWSRASCRKNRTVHVTQTDATGASSGPEAVTTTGPNGNYAAVITLAAPATPATSATYTLTATVDQAMRKSGKSKGKSDRARKHVCAALTSAPVTVTTTAPPTV